MRIGEETSTADVAGVVGGIAYAATAEALVSEMDSRDLDIYQYSDRSSKRKSYLKLSFLKSSFIWSSCCKVALAFAICETMPYQSFNLEKGLQSSRKVTIVQTNETALVSIQNEHYERVAGPMPRLQMNCRAHLLPLLGRTPWQYHPQVHRQICWRPTQEVLIRLRTLLSPEEQFSLVFMDLIKAIEDELPWLQRVRHP